MAIMSITSRKRAWDIGLSAIVMALGWLMQVALVTRVPLNQVLCNLPLAMTIVWGTTFGSPLGRLTSDQLRHLSITTVFVRQMLSGSVSGAMVGGFFGLLYAHILPVYPYSYPLIGWVAGYFCLRGINQAMFLTIPLVFLMTALSESLTAIQLHLIGRPDVLNHLAEFVFPEAGLNAVISPFLFFPMRAWAEYSTSILRQK